MPAVAPTVAINGIPDGKQRDTADLSLDITGGSYSRLTYNWSSNFGGTDQFSDHTIAAPTWTRPDVSNDKNVSVKCIVTAHDDNDHTQAVRTDTEPTTILHVQHADAPSISVDPIPGGRERTQVQLNSNLGLTHIGNYDEIDYRWEVNQNFADRADTQLDDKTKRNPIWTRPDVANNHTDTPVITCHITARGTNGRALRGTSETTAATRHTTVTDIHDADAPSFDHIQTTNFDPDDPGEPNYQPGLRNGLEGTEFYARVEYGEANDGKYDQLNIEIALEKADGSGDQEQVQMWTWNRAADDPDEGEHEARTDAFLFTRPLVDANTRYHLVCSITALGADREAEIATQERITGQSDAGTVQNRPQATLPTTLQIQDAGIGGENFQGGIRNGTEKDYTHVRVHNSGGNYDTIEWDWELVAHGGEAGTGISTPFLNPSQNGTNLTYPDVATHQQYDALCTVTVHGTGNRAEDGSTATRTLRASFWSNPLPAADAPSIELEAIPNGQAETTFDPVIHIGRNHAGRFDRLEYLWEMYEHGDRTVDLAGDALDDKTSPTPTLTRGNNTAHDLRSDIRCTVTAYGGDANANAGTSESSSTPYRTWTTTPLPAAAVPAGVSLDPVPEGVEGTSAHCHINVPAGDYDGVTYRWGAVRVSDSVETGFGSARSPDAIWHRPEVTGDGVAFRIVCVLIFQGFGFKARSGTMAQQTYSVDTTVDDAPPEPLDIMTVTDADGTPRGVTEIAISDATGRGRTITGVVVTSGNGTPITVYEHGA